MKRGNAEREQEEKKGKRRER